MMIIDENGTIELLDGTLKPIESVDPVYKARNALGLPLGEWLYAPDTGHNLNAYKTVKATPAKMEEFTKAVRLYLAPYGDQIVSRYLNRGQISLSLDITKDKS